MNNIFIVLIIVSLVACTSIKSHEKTAQEHASQAGLTAIAKPHFDVAFKRSSTAFSHYKKIIINDLDWSETVIIQPDSSNSINSLWALSDDDKRYYQNWFSESANRNLLDSELFALAKNSDADTLLIKPKITEIAPHASKDDITSRSTIMSVYSKGFGRMTIVFEVYDSVTNELVMVATDQRDLGNVWEINNRVQNNLQIRLAFDVWLSSLKRQLKDLVKN